MARIERSEEGRPIRARRATRAHVSFLFSLFFLLFRNATSRQPEGEPRSRERHRQQELGGQRRRRRVRAPKNRQYGAVDVLQEQHVDSRDVAVQRGDVRNRAFRPVVVTAGGGSVLPTAG